MFILICRDGVGVDLCRTMMKEAHELYGKDRTFMSWGYQQVSY